MSVGKIKPAIQLDSQSQKHHQQKEEKARPELTVIEGGQSYPQSHFEDRILDIPNPQVYKDPTKLIRFFQLIGEGTLKFAVYSKQRCLKLYEVAVGLQKKIGKNSRGGIIDKKAE